MEGDDLSEGMHTVENVVTPRINEKKEDNLKENFTDKVDDMVSQTNVHHDDGHDLQGETNGGEDKAKPVNTEGGKKKTVSNENKTRNLREENGHRHHRHPILLLLIHSPLLKKQSWPSQALMFQTLQFQCPSC